LVADLQRRFNARRLGLLGARTERQKRLDRGENLDFLDKTRKIRESEWTKDGRRIELSEGIIEEELAKQQQCGDARRFAAYEKSRGVHAGIDPGAEVCGVLDGSGLPADFRRGALRLG